MIYSSKCIYAAPQFSLCLKQAILAPDLLRLHSHQIRYCQKNSSPPIHLNGSSVFRLWEQGLHGVLQKNAAALRKEVEPRSTYAETQTDVTLRWPIT